MLFAFLKSHFNSPSTCVDWYDLFWRETHICGIEILISMSAWFISHVDSAHCNESISLAKPKPKTAYQVYNPWATAIPRKIGCDCFTFNKQHPWASWVSNLLHVVYQFVLGILQVELDATLHQDRIYWHWFRESFGACMLTKSLITDDYERYIRKSVVPRKCWAKIFTWPRQQIEPTICWGNNGCPNTGALPCVWRYWNDSYVWLHPQRKARLSLSIGRM